MAKDTQRCMGSLSLLRAYSAGNSSQKSLYYFTPFTATERSMLFLCDFGIQLYSVSVLQTVGPECRVVVAARVGT